MKERVEFFNLLFTILMPPLIAGLFFFSLIMAIRVGAAIQEMKDYINERRKNDGSICRHSRK